MAESKEEWTLPLLSHLVPNSLIDHSIPPQTTETFYDADKVLKK